MVKGRVKPIKHKERIDTRFANESRIISAIAPQINNVF
ncbi:hypothetical protein N0824_02607 [Microcystis sp. 0824]|nr:hypothetical protein N0824_02607 [Microcystis sp. 0824]